MSKPHARCSDRQVTLDLPDRKDRVALLGLHARSVPLAPDVDLDRRARELACALTARKTPGEVRECLEVCAVDVRAMHAGYPAWHVASVSAATH